MPITQIRSSDVTDLYLVQPWAITPNIGQRPGAVCAVLRFRPGCCFPDAYCNIDISPFSETFFRVLNIKGTEYRSLKGYHLHWVKKFGFRYFLRMDVFDMESRMSACSRWCKQIFELQLFDFSWYSLNVYIYIYIYQRKINHFWFSPQSNSNPDMGMYRYPEIILYIQEPIPRFSVTFQVIQSGFEVMLEKNKSQPSPFLLFELKSWTIEIFPDSNEFEINS